MSIAASNCCLRRGKRMSADRGRGVSFRSLKRHISISNRRTLVRKRSLNEKRDTRAFRGTRSFTEFMTTPPKISEYRYSCRFGNGKYARMQTTCVIPWAVCRWGACVHPLFLALCTYKFQLPWYSLAFFSCPLLRFTYFSDVALSVFRVAIGRKQ